MARLNAREIAEKQVRNSQNAATDYVSGVKKVTESPMQKAKQKQDKLVQNFNQSVSSGKWAEGLDAVSLEDWRKMTETKGGQRYASGVKEAMPKTQAFLEEFLPFVEQVQQEVNAMPDMTLEDNINRMAANARALSRFKRTRRRR